MNTWQATVELRWVVWPVRGDPSALPPRLQQRWVCIRSDDPAKLGTEEWRDVPAVDCWNYRPVD
jgi:hypothetical protein